MLSYVWPSRRTSRKKDRNGGWRQGNRHLSVGWLCQSQVGVLPFQHSSSPSSVRSLWFCSLLPILLCMTSADVAWDKSATNGICMPSHIPIHSVVGYLGFTSSRKKKKWRGAMHVHIKEKEGTIHLLYCMPRRRSRIWIKVAGAWVLWKAWNIRNWSPRLFFDRKFLQSAALVSCLSIIYIL